MTTKLTKIALITAALMTQGAYLSATMTDAEEQTEVERIAASRKQLSADNVWHTTFDLSSQLDKARVGTVTLTTNSASYFSYDSTTRTVKMLSTDTTNGNWSLYQAVLSASYNATTGISLDEVNRDGTANPASPKLFVLTATKGNNAADAQASAIGAFIAGSKVFNFTTLTGTGLAITSSASAVTGWTFTGRFLDNNSAAFAGAADPISQGYTMPLTLSDGSSVSLTTKVTGLDAYLVAANATTQKTVKFTKDNFEAEFMTKPGSYVHTASIATGVLTSLNSLTGLAIKSKGLYPSLVQANTAVRAKVGTTTGDLDTDLNAVADGIVASYTAIGKYGTALSTTHGFTILGATDATSVTWSADDDYLVATATVGSGLAKAFRYQLTGDVMKDDTQNQIKLVADDGDVIYVGCFDSTGLDYSATTGLSAAGKKAALADALANLFNTGNITTVGHKTLKQLP